MKDLNAAYEGLRYPARRAAYDHEPLSLTADVEPADAEYRGWTDEWQPALSTQQLFACRQHTSVASVGTCCNCGGGALQGEISAQAKNDEEPEHGQQVLHAPAAGPGRHGGWAAGGWNRSKQ
jgi:hypothetical protein